MKFSERLKFLRNKHLLTQAELARVANVSERGLRKFESGENNPNMIVLVALADFFDISIDYLIGRSDDPERR